MTAINFQKTVQVITSGNEQEVFNYLFNNMMIDIIEMINEKKLPPDIKTLGEIDDYVDSNDVGYVCRDDVFDALITRYGGRDEHEGMPSGMFDLLDKLKDKINRWLQ